MLRHPDQPRGVVLPLDPRTGEHPDALGGPVMLVGWRPEAAASGRFWGDTVPIGSELARQLARATTRRPSPGVTPAGGLTFRLALPEAFGAESLLALTDRAAGSGEVGPVRVPLAGPRGHGPVPGVPLGLMALTLLTEIAATDVQNRVLTEITTAVRDLAPGCSTSLDPRVRAAEETLRDAQTALLAGGAIPEAVALGTATANLSVLRHQAVALLAGWERVAEAADTSGTPGSVLREGLGEIGRLGWAGFPGAVHGMYQALVLDARRALLVAGEHQLRSPDRPLSAMRPQLEPDVVARTAEIARLRRVLGRLSVVPLTVRKRTSGMLPNLIADAALENSRTQVLFTRMANALTPRAVAGPGTFDLEVQTRASGELQVLRPA